ncbi:hypothetical protein GGTG_01933 [Gaeumannomyces tritici R3-111a-1]|uniref:Uncharacterized protein n=1 Tax=Gaeumannomyces tritici (strain R3-111a-1) TaxID=644352 RepID=J3NKZ2_GAET3|nr:hypothetical protein GGTG_01933 [Gaeumannomyces tritici R3-111a-1]EJT81959.1 hypothetical protein GGTG_01933 [Gaeumannomyces tritici R3-111a-1]
MTASAFVPRFRSLLAPHAQKQQMTNARLGIQSRLTSIVSLRPQSRRDQTGSSARGCYPSSLGRVKRRDGFHCATGQGPHPLSWRPACGRPDDAKSGKLWSYTTGPGLRHATARPSSELLAAMVAPRSSPAGDMPPPLPYQADLRRHAHYKKTAFTSSDRNRNSGHGRGDLSVLTAS